MGTGESGEPQNREEPWGKEGPVQHLCGPLIWGEDALHGTLFFPWGVRTPGHSPLCPLAQGTVCNVGAGASPPSLGSVSGAARMERAAGPAHCLRPAPPRCWQGHPTHRSITGKGQTGGGVQCDPGNLLKRCCPSCLPTRAQPQVKEENLGFCRQGWSGLELVTGPLEAGVMG